MLHPKTVMKPIAFLFFALAAAIAFPPARAQTGRSIKPTNPLTRSSQAAEPVEQSEAVLPIKEGKPGFFAPSLSQLTQYAHVDKAIVEAEPAEQQVKGYDRMKLLREMHARNAERYRKKTQEVPQAVKPPENETTYKKARKLKDLKASHKVHSISVPFKF